MKYKTTDVVELLAGLATTHDEDIAGAEHSPKAQALLAAILATPVPEIAGGRSKRLYSTRRWRRRLVLAAGLGAAAAAALLAGLAIRAPHVPVTTSAGKLLRQAASAAQRQRPLLLRPGQYVYTKSITAHLTAVKPPSGHGEAYVLVARKVRESWHGPNGGLLRERRVRPQFLSARDRAAWIAAGRPSLQTTSLTGQKLPALRPADLPTDPDMLYRRLKRRAAKRSRELYPEMFTLIGDALRATNTSPAQRAALYMVVARIPQVELLGRVRDPVGRPGVAVAMSNQRDKIREILIFNTHTAALLAEERLTLAGNLLGYPADTPLNYATYLTSAVVDSTRERP